MFKILSKRERIIIFCGLIIHLLVAFFSIGFHQGDEHWQINEFANGKLGLSNMNELPWEYAKQARQTIQTCIVYVVSKVAMAVNAYNPFGISLFFRILSGVLGFISTLLLVLQSRKYFQSPGIFEWVLITSNFLWFIPYVHVRFQGENWGGIFLGFSVSLLLWILENNRKSVLLFFVGLLMGFSFICRFQIGFALAAIGLWMLLFRKASFAGFAYMALGFSVMVFVGVLSDFWYYGSWIFMPYRYFDLQLLQGLSNTWGVFPWWHYGTLFLMHAAPPISIILFVMLIISTFLNPKHLFVWIIWGFVLGHNLNGYKEIRYLFPLIPYLVVLVFLIFNSTYVSEYVFAIKPKILKMIVVILLIQNFVLLIFAGFKPAHDAVGMYSKVYYSSQNKKAIVYYIGQNPYVYAKTLHLNYYSPKGLQLIQCDSLCTNINKPDPTEKVFIFYEGFERPRSLNSLYLTSVYSTIPLWTKSLNFNNWQSRARNWNLCELNASDPDK
jgi:phosphatidylinositol glycan class B